MTAAPGDETAPWITGRERLRAAQADRERAVQMLKTAFAEGRLAKDEFDQRVGQALGSRTYAELAAATAGVRGTDVRASDRGTDVRADVQGTGVKAGGRGTDTKNGDGGPEVRAGVRVIAAIYLTANILWLAAVLAGDNAAGGAAAFLAFMMVVVAVFSSLYGAVVLLGSARHRRSRGQPLADDPDLTRQGIANEA